MTHIPLSAANLSPEALAALREVAERGARVVFDVAGIGAIAAVPVDDAARLEAEEDAGAEAAIRESLAEPGENVPLDQLLRECELD